MKRLITILTLVALIGGISVAAFAVPTDTDTVNVSWNTGSWIILYIPFGDRAVALSPIWPVGAAYPVFSRLPAVVSTAFVWTNMAGGFTLIVEANAVAAPIGVTLGEVAQFFDIRGGLLLDWTALPTGTAPTLLSSMVPGSFSATGIDYQFRFNPAYHLPGDYTLTLLFTATGR